MTTMILIGIFAGSLVGLILFGIYLLLRDRRSAQDSRSGMEGRIPLSVSPSLEAELYYVFSGFLPKRRSRFVLVVRATGMQVGRTSRALMRISRRGIERKWRSGIQYTRLAGRRSGNGKNAHVAENTTSRFLRDISAHKERLQERLKKEEEE